jgi:hypothetical protein
MTSPVKNADARLANLRAELAALYKELKECEVSPNPAKEDQLFTKANELLGQLSKELQKTRDETAGYGYDTTDFDTLKYQIQGFKQDVKYTLLNSSVRKELEIKLGPDWVANARTDLMWFHGTYMGPAISILNDKCFKAEATGGAGKKFGPGTYCTQVPAVAEQYGSCIFGISLAGRNILTARDTSRGPQIWTGAQWEAAPAEIHGSANLCAALTIWAKDKRYDAIEFTESSEGHILILLIDVPIDATNVAYLKKYD